MENPSLCVSMAATDFPKLLFLPKRAIVEADPGVAPFFSNRRYVLLHVRRRVPKTPFLSSFSTFICMK